MATLYDSAASDNYASNWTNINGAFSFDTDHYKSATNNGDTDATRSSTASATFFGVQADVLNTVANGGGNNVMIGFGEGSISTDSSLDLVEDGYYFRYNPNNNQIELAKVISGTRTQLYYDDSNNDYSYDVYYTIEIFREGDDVVVKIDDTEVIRVADTDYTPTSNTTLRFGARRGFSNGSNIQFKNIYYIEESSPNAVVNAGAQAMAMTIPAPTVVATAPNALVEPGVLGMEIAQPSVSIVETDGYLYDDCADNDIASLWTVINSSFQFDTDHYESSPSSGDTAVIRTDTSSAYFGVEVEAANGIVNGDGNTIMVGFGEGGISGDTLDDIVDDGYYLDITPSVTRTQLIKMVSGSSTILAENLSSPITYGTYYTFKVYRDGDEVVVEVDGSEEFRVTDTDYTPTSNTSLRIGSRTGFSNGSYVEFKNVSYIPENTNTGVTVNAGTLGMEVSIPAPTVTAEQPNALVQPNAMALELSIPSPTVSLTSPPSGLTFTNVTEHSMQLNWIKAPDTDRTLIIMKKGSAPSSSSDGVKVYNGTGTSCVVNHLETGETYHFALYGNNVSYSLGTENEATTNGTPHNIAVTDQYIFIALPSGNGVEVRKRSAPGTVAMTLAPAELGANGLQAIDAKGNYLCFTAGDYVFIYEFVSESDYTALHIEDVGNGTLRAAHIDTEQEYVYFGNQSGTLVYFDIATLTKRTFSVAGEVLRDIDTYGDQLVTASNNDNLYDIDRSNRTSMSSNGVVRDFGINAEVAQVDANYIYGASDATNVEIRNNTSPYGLVETLSNPGNDITSVSIEDGDYISVSSDDYKVYVYDVNDSYNLLSTITTVAGMEDSWMQDGDLYYTSGSEGATQSKFFYRTYLTEDIDEGVLLEGSQMTRQDVTVTPSPMTMEMVVGTAAVESNNTMAVGVQNMEMALPQSNVSLVDIVQANVQEIRMAIGSPSVVSNLILTPDPFTVAVAIPSHQVRLEQIVEASIFAAAFEIPAVTIFEQVLITPDPLALEMAVPGATVFGSNYQIKYPAQGDVYSVKYDI